MDHRGVMARDESAKLILDHIRSFPSEVGLSRYEAHVPSDNFPFMIEVESPML